MVTKTPPDALSRALQAFDEGNYALARTLATELASNSDGDIAAQAKELLVRLSPAPLGKYLLLLTGILLLATTVFVYLQ